MEIKTISFDEFHRLAALKVEEGFKGVAMSEIFNSLMGEGFTKLTQDNIPIFLKDNFIYFTENLIVDFGNPQFVWIVCGMDALLINKS